MAINRNPNGSGVKNELTEEGMMKEDIIENDGEDLKIEIKNTFSMSNKSIKNPFQCSADGCDYIARDNSVLRRHIRWRHAGKIVFQFISYLFTNYIFLKLLIFFQVKSRLNVNFVI